MEVKGTISILEVEAEGTAVAVVVDTSVFTCGQPNHWAVHLVETVVEMAATLLMIVVIGTWQGIISSFSSSPRTIKTWSHTVGGAHFGGQ
jgi:hypothetical protein